MKYSLMLAKEEATAKIAVNLHSLWIAVAALSCAYLVEAKNLDYTYPLHLLIEGVATDTDTITDIRTK